MPISASRLTPVRYVFKCDPDEQSWVEIKPLDARMDELRANLLSTQEFYWEGGTFVQRVNVNPRSLEAREMFLSFSKAHIVIDGPDGEEVLFQAEPMTEQAFSQDLNKLPRIARREWVDAVRDNIEAWKLPF